MNRWLLVVLVSMCGCGGLPFTLDQAGVDLESDAGAALDQRVSSPESGGAPDPDSGGGVTLESDAGSAPDTLPGVDVRSADAATCTTSTIRCAGLQPQTCASGAWIDSGAACTDVCLDGSCAACSPGATQCSSSAQPQTCSAAGEWQDGATCANQACVNGSCAGTCAPGATQCSTTTQPQTCSASGTWVNVAACTNQTCVSGACVGVCAPDQGQCAGNALQYCGSDGQWGAVGPSCTDEGVGGCCAVKSSGVICDVCP